MNKIIYIKYSNDRADRFKISTRIEEKSDGTKVIYKKAENSRAVEHIERIYENYKLLCEFVKDRNLTMDFEVNRCEKEGTELKFEYISGDSYQKELCNMYLRGEMEAFYNTLDTYVNCLRSAAVNEFESTQEFRAIFGEYETDNTEYSMSATNVDFNFDNILISDKYTIIDYEWVYDFPIPVDFVIFRALNYLAIEIKGVEGNPYEFRTRLAERYGISDERIDSYGRMEQNFFKYVGGGDASINDLFYDIGKRRPTMNDMMSAYDKEYDKRTFQVYYDYGSGYCDEHIIHARQGEDGDINLTIDVPDGAAAVRLDPGNNRCIVIMSSCNLNYLSNGYKVNNNMICFNTDDPQIIFENITSGIKRINVSMVFNAFYGDMGRLIAETVEDVVRSRDNLETELGNKQRECEEYRNSLSWKITTPLRIIRSCAEKILKK